jgi:hypothetical protein
LAFAERDFRLGAYPLFEGIAQGNRKGRHWRSTTMNLLRASVHQRAGWCEFQLLDLDIIADGADEDAAVRELEHALIAEYHLAIKYGHTPFVKLLTAVPTEVQDSWENGNKGFRELQLPPEVALALSAVFHVPNLSAFRLKKVA